MEKPLISLSRLGITGLVDPATPEVVLKEIASAHSIIYEEDRLKEPRYLARLINIINTKGVNTVRAPYDLKDLQLIARFVNKNRQWKKGQLNQAFDLLMEYTKLEKLTEVHRGFKFGPQTPEHPDSLNACVLYGICAANRIETRPESSLDEMASNIKMLFSLRNPDIYHSIRTTIHEAMMYGGCEGYQLINILRQIDPKRAIDIMNSNSHDNNPASIIQNIENTQEIRINHGDLSLTADEIRQRGIRTRPQNHVEAVAMAAIYYKIDISKVKNPLAEYQELIRSPYLPRDRDLTKRLQISNKYSDSLENPHIDQVFNPNLPQNLYDDNDLIAMCLEEGYTNDEIRNEGAYSLLQASCFLATFFHGKQGNITNVETTMLDPIYSMEDEEGLNYDNVIVYGIREEEMRAYSYGELTETFRFTKRFQRPDATFESFSDIVINKLYMLCHKDQRAGESEECLRDRLELAEEIGRVRLYLQTNQRQVREFVDRYENSEPEEKRRIEDFLTQLLHSGMYMRGWNGEDPYPLASQDTQTEREEQLNIDLRVTGSIIQLEETIEALNDMNGLGNLIKELPLILYSHVDNELIPSTDEREGLTIVDRINIVRGGEDGSIQSCIRMSSNRFCASAYYYINLLHIETPFSIEDMAHIQ